MLQRVQAVIMVAVAVSGCVAAGGSPRSQARTNSTMAVDQNAIRCVRWTEAEAIVTSDRKSVYFEAPTAVRLTSAIALFGYPTFITGDSATEVTVAMGAQVNRDGSMTAIMSPGPSTEHPSDVMAVEDGHGGAQVFWKSVPMGSRPSVETSTVFGARFDNGTWATPEVVLAGDFIRWNRFSAATTTIRDETYVVASSRRNGVGGIQIVRGRPGKWETSWITTGSFGPAYLAFSAQEGRPWVIAFVGSVHTRTMNVLNGAFVTVSLDEGRTWSDPTVVRDFGNDTRHWIQLAPTADGNLHMFWAASGLITADRKVEHLVSNDGLAWRPEADVGMANTFHVMTTDLGTLLVTYIDQSTGQVSVSEWDGKTWKGAATLGANAATNPRAITLGKDSLHIVWGSARGLRPPVSLWARRSSCGGRE